MFYDEDGKAKTAKWSHLETLLELEKGNLLKLSKLDEVSVYPKPIERQKVSTCFFGRNCYRVANSPGYGRD